MQLKDKDVLFHINKWWWGESIEIVRKDGLAMISVELDEKNSPNVAHFCDFSVFETERRHGLGDNMLDHAFSVAKKYGKTFARLYCDKSRSWLKEWYERRGFKIYAQNEHEYEMIKEL